MGRREKGVGERKRRLEWNKGAGRKRTYEVQPCKNKLFEGYQLSI